MILYLDCAAGVAGDMLVAALIHAGAPLEAVLADVRSVGIPGWEARVERVFRGPYAATRFVVEPIAGAQTSSVVEQRSHDHGHAHDVDQRAHGHGHDHSHDPVGDDIFPGQPPRDWATIRALLQASGLPVPVRDASIAVFTRLAEAESRVHGVPVDGVQFHEVGAVDSIVDIVAACSAMAHLGVRTVVSTPLPMGQGTVRTAHGLLPIPVPATVEVLRGFPVMPSPFGGELVTPTGAAIVATLAVPGPMPAMIVRSVGYGAGSRNPRAHANVLRVVIGDGDAGGVAQVAELTAQVDDLAGEAVPPLLDALFAAGAVDAFVVPVVMKKGRPGLWIHALCPPDARAAVGDALLRHSGSFGYRHHLLDREVLARHHETVETAFGAVRLKVGARAGAVFHTAPEYEDCAAAAQSHGVPVSEVYRAVLAAAAPKAHE